MKKICAFVLSLALLAALALPAAAVEYTDIPPGSTLKEEIRKADAYGLMNGYTAATFGYGDSMTRAQFAAVLVRMMGWPASSAAVSSFGDVSASHTWYQAIETAAAHDVVDTGAAFRPSAAITRAEMAEMLVRALGLKSAAALTRQMWTKRSTAFLPSLPFTDVSGDSAAYIAVAYAIGMTKGTSAATFAPAATATRAQAAAMLVRIYEKLHPQATFAHGFYAIASYSQIGLTDELDAVSAGWSRMIWDGTAAVLSTTSADGNEYCIPGGYDSVVNTLAGQGTALNLSVYMDPSGGLTGLLSSASGRAQAVEQIINELTVSYKTIGKNPYSGVTIDFEGLRSAQKDDFNAFLSALSLQVKKLDKSFYVCVSPVLTTGSYYDGYDYPTISSLADKIILMAYDYDSRDLSAYVGTEYYKTAATAPIDQVYLSLLIAAGAADVSKLVLGFSAKNMAWEIDANGKLVSGTPIEVSAATAAARLAQSDTVQGWSEEYQMPYAIYTTQSGQRYFLWYQDNESVQTARNAARLLGVTGVSLWRLGTLPTLPGNNWMNLLES